MDHREAVPIVADWARGRLDAGAARAVEEHVRTCAECQAVAAAAVGLETESRRLGATAGAHPNPEALARYVETPESESVATLATVGSHLRACDPCREDVTLMRQAAAPSWLRSLGAWLSPAPSGLGVLQPALAVLAVLLVYPAWLGLVERPRERVAAERRLGESEQRLRTEAQARERSARLAGGAARGGGIAALVLRGSTRGGESLPVLRLRPGQTLQPVLLDVALAPGRVHVRLIREPDREVWAVEGASEEFWDEANGLVGLLVPAEVLAPGEHRIELRATTGGPPFFQGRFRILPAP